MNNKTFSIDNQYRVSPRELGIYIHIPFCVKKCDYCDFLSAPSSEEMKKQYIEALLTEIESKHSEMEDFIVPTIFIGGGTPSCVDATDIARIMDAIRSIVKVDEKQLEATIEVNPGNVTRDKLLTYQKAGINRLSFGLQSVNNEELALLGRIHTFEQFTENYHLAREVGFPNINVDLMSALPGQTLTSWEYTLNTVLALHPEHISAYSLIVEEDTKFYDLYREGGIRNGDLPDEETDRQMYHITKEILKTYGYERYEISNYAKSGYSCAHNCTYWNGKEYLGFGVGAASLFKGTRMTNMHDVKHYIHLCTNFKNNTSGDSDGDSGRDSSDHSQENITNDPIGVMIESEELNIQQRMEEFMFLGLRMTKGISRKAFQQRFEVDIDSVYGNVLQKLLQQKLIRMDQDRISLTEFGTDVSNVALAEFLLDE
jgi:oxygen-independent coproporphyrinogen-3 oxidase